MGKIRLNEGHRAFLRGLAHQTVRCPDQERLDQEAYDVAAPLVRKIVEDRYPRRDMTVLKKYEQAHHVVSVRIQLSPGGVAEFTFRGEGAGPMTAGEQGAWSCRQRIYLADEETTIRINESLTATDNIKEALREKLCDYTALINNAKTLEEIEAVWPEAGALRNRLNRALPTILSVETLDRIRNDAPNRAPIPVAEAQAAG